MDPTIAALINEGAELLQKARILDCYPDLIIAFDADKSLSGNISYASNAVIDFFGLANEEAIVGTSFWELLTDESKLVIQKEVKDAVIAGVKDGEEFICLPDGMPLLAHIARTNEQGHRETQRVSLKATVHMTYDTPECICALRLVDNDVQTNNINSSDVIVSDTEESKISQGRNGHRVSFKRTAADESHTIKRTKVCGDFWGCD